MHKLSGRRRRRYFLRKIKSNTVLFIYIKGQSMCVCIYVEMEAPPFMRYLLLLFFCWPAPHPTPAAGRGKSLRLCGGVGLRYRDRVRSRLVFSGVTTPVESTRSTTKFFKKSSKIFFFFSFLF